MVPDLKSMSLNHPDWLFEIKYEGFRSLAYVDDGCELVSRNEFHYQRSKDLAESLASDLAVSNVILDGEIVCIGDKGHSRFYDLMGNRGVAIFAVVDVVWLDGEDLRDQPLSDRKETLREIVPESPDRMLYRCLLGRVNSTVHRAQFHAPRRGPPKRQGWFTNHFRVLREQSQTRRYQ